MADAVVTGAKAPRQCDITRKANADARRQRVCEHCGSGFREGSRSGKQSKEGQRQKYCSVACRNAAYRVYPSEAEARRAEWARKRARDGLPPPFVECTKECVVCAAAFTARAPSATKCEACRLRRVERQTRPCADCGEPVTGTAAKRRCDGCARRRGRDRHNKLHGATKKHRQRARRFGVPYEPVNPIKVFDRDRWHCQLCGRQTPKRLRGTNDGRAPELDHIVPMSKGGPHTYTNTQCSCRDCNIRKGDSIKGQMRLFG